MTGPLLWIDVETTGLNPEKNGIISLAAIADFDGVEVDSKVFHMNPRGREIEDGALKVNGFTREEITSFPPWGMVRLEFKAWILQTFTAGFVPVPVGGFNHVWFDCRFIREWFTQTGGLFDEWFRAEEQYDVMLLVKRDLSGRFDKLENRKLVTVANSLGVALGESAHKAEADIRATREIFYKFHAGEYPK